MTSIQQGVALAMYGQADAGITQRCQGLAGWQTTGSKVAGTRWRALLAEAYGVGARVDDYSYQANDQDSELGQPA